ncbi:unnamed protein product [Amoebophrya sp. A25]|nr:unnamed protein product [Amoebophrya sp. A25]|eukprot:GSA25T00022473001.1
MTSSTDASTGRAGNTKTVSAPKKQHWRRLNLRSKTASNRAEANAQQALQQSVAGDQHMIKAAIGNDESTGAGSGVMDVVNGKVSKNLLPPSRNYDLHSSQDQQRDDREQDGTTASGKAASGKAFLEDLHRRGGVAQLHGPNYPVVVGDTQELQAAGTSSSLSLKLSQPALSKSNAAGPGAAVGAGTSQAGQVSRGGQLSKMKSSLLVEDEREKYTEQVLTELVNAVGGNANGLEERGDHDGDTEEDHKRVIRLVVPPRPKCLPRKMRRLNPQPTASTEGASRRRSPARSPARILIQQQSETKSIVVEQEADVAVARTRDEDENKMQIEPPEIKVEDRNANPADVVHLASSATTSATSDNTIMNSSSTPARVLPPAETETSATSEKTSTSHGQSHDRSGEYMVGGIARDPYDEVCCGFSYLNATAYAVREMQDKHGSWKCVRTGKEYRPGELWPKSTGGSADVAEEMSELCGRKSEGEEDDESGEPVGGSDFSLVLPTNKEAVEGPPSLLQRLKACHLEWVKPRVVIYDVDVHHGNGTQAVFYDDPTVLFVSIHRGQLSIEHQSTPDYVGIGAGEGYNVNLPLCLHDGDVVALSYTHAIACPVIEQFQPDLIVVSLGFDALDVQNSQHCGEQIQAAGCDCLFSPMVFAHIIRALQPLCPRIVLHSEGGYDPQQCGEAARHSLKALLGQPLDPWRGEAGEDRLLYRRIHNFVKHFSRFGWQFPVRNAAENFWKLQQGNFP